MQCRADGKKQAGEGCDGRLEVANCEVSTVLTRSRRDEMGRTVGTVRRVVG